MPRPPASPSPPPASFTFTVGGFDYPHASGSPSSRSRGGPTIRRGQPALSSTSDQDSPAPHVAPDPRPPPRRLPQAGRRSTMHTLFARPRDNVSPDHLAQRPPAANSHRPRATPSERYLRRSAARIREARDNMESSADFLDAFSDIPIINPFAVLHAGLRPRSPIVEVGSDRSQTKRRKLEHNANRKSEYDGFKYGYKGQVVPGQLKMEVVSCDGSEYSGNHHFVGPHNAMNVLKHDGNVYTSEGPQCNLLLKHIGDFPFSLQKIIIRAPNPGLTAPIQEGLIFVSMSADDLLSSTAGYDLQYLSRRPPRSCSGSQHSLRGAQHEMEERIRNLRLRIDRRNRESSASPGPERYANQRHPTQHEEDLYSENCDALTDDSRSGILRLSAPTPPPFTVAAANGEEEDHSSEDWPSAAAMTNLMSEPSFSRSDMEDVDNQIRPRLGGLREALALDLNIEPTRATEVDVPSQVGPTHSLPEADNLLIPHARFCIASDKSKIVINFRPAVSGKSILLKLWSTMYDGKIDIESVQVYGFSGPRFFPARQVC